ncbi:MAG: ribonuclease III [Candidatus Woesebacteria bacterium]|jgi:ribonuclease-3
MAKTNKLESLFDDKELFMKAMTHRSWVNEHKNSRRSNERLEFLGDAVLEFIVSKELYNKLPQKEEGYLTALRANIVNTLNLSKVAKKLKIGKSLFLSKGEEESGGRDNKSLLADTVEAIIGALFIDKGLKETEEFIKKNLLSDLDEKIARPLKDAKSRLQELVQAQGLGAPVYKVTSEEGPDHNKKFTVEVEINKESVTHGLGSSKSEAEQQAASKALKSIFVKGIKNI